MERFCLDFDLEGHFIVGNHFKVYLAGPITNNDAEQVKRSSEVREIIRRTFEAYYEVTFEVYDPAEYTGLASQHSPEDVYSIDHLRTMDADLVLFHVNAPSLGVGIEAQIAADATVPRVLIHHRAAQVSRMFKGVFSPTVAEIAYDQPDELLDRITQVMPNIDKAIRGSAKQRRRVNEMIASNRIGRFILRQRIDLGLPIAALARETDIREFWLRRIERHEELSICMTLVMIQRIAMSLKCAVAVTDELGITLRSTTDPVSKPSLESLVDFVLADGEWKDDETILTLWRDHVDEEHALRVSRDRRTSPVTVDEWRELYSEATKRSPSEESDQWNLNL